MLELAWLSAKNDAPAWERRNSIVGVPGVAR